MVRHIVAWSFKEGFTDSEKQAHLQKIKSSLEVLPAVVGGVVELNVQIDLLETSNLSAMLNSLFKSEEALKAYQIHPEHKKVSEFVRSVMEDRVCLDYEEERVGK